MKMTMKYMRRRLLAITSVFAFGLAAMGVDAPEGFALVSKKTSATVVVPASEPECVRLAAQDLVSDVEKITGKKLVLAASADQAGSPCVVLASLNRAESAAALEKLAPGLGNNLKGKWEAYRVKNVGARLVIAGSDERGTMFGLYAFIEKYLGVDPLYYWAGRPPKARATLSWDKVELAAGEPTFHFRGWFVNDEDLLTEFRLDGGDRHIDYPFYQKVISPSVSARIFEAALRLQMNLVIPSSFVDIRNPAEARLIEDATKRGLFVTMHHVEPMGVSAFAFENYWKDRGEKVPFQFTQHPDKFREIWRDYAQRWAKFAPQVIWQLGLRGIADRPVWLADPNVPKSDEGRGKLISDAMSAQWEIVRSVDKQPTPLGSTTLWMEGAGLHAAGHLKFPENIMVIFSDNSPGWELQDDFYNVKRETGRNYGIYYHHQLWGTGPHLVQGVSVWRTHKIFKEAVKRGSTYYAILNVSNVREFVLGLDGNARMLRDFPNFDPGKYLTAWCVEHFGNHAKDAELVYRKHFSTFLADSKTGARAMLDGEWMHAGTRLAKALAARLEKGGKSDGKTAGLLKKLRPELETQQGVAFSAKELAAKLKGNPKEFFENNLVAQNAIMLGLLQWIQHVGEADLALDAGDTAAVKQQLEATKEAVALIESGKALASRGEFKDWYRGERKMNCAQLGELTSKLVALSAALPAGSPSKRVEQTVAFPCIGKLGTRHARDIKSSWWSVGGETLDRDFAIYANYKSYLGPLGAKGLRVQAGWAKCEKTPGVYSWEWLDEVVNDARAQGVQPWLETSYGNPIYPDGGGTGLGGGLPTSPEALQAWDAWVKAIVNRYKDRVNEWEVWNEPDGGHGITAEGFAKFYLRTAAIIRREQPAARIYAFGLANSGKTVFVEAMLNLAKETGQLGLVDAITIHGYPKNPDDARSIEHFRELVARYSPNITIRQGETGAPSGETVGALRDVPWTEQKQAKWDLRRMLVHRGKDAPFNLFTLCELKYAQKNMSGFNRKGLLRCNDDQTVAGAKPAYYAAQRVFAIFDDALPRVPDFKFEAATEEKLAVHAYRKQGTEALVVATWLYGAPPLDSNQITPVDLTFQAARFTAPVYADLLTGLVYEIPKEQWAMKDGAACFKQIPVYDSPIIIAEKSALLIMAQDAK